MIENFNQFDHELLLSFVVDVSREILSYSLPNADVIQIESVCELFVTVEESLRDLRYRGRLQYKDDSPY